MVTNFLKALLRRRQLLDRADYKKRLDNEQTSYARCENVHDLPPIFHYWSNKYLRPKLEPFGFSSPDEFFFKFCLRQCKGRSRARMASIGAGNCDLEAGLAGKLAEAGLRNFTIECIDINEEMIRRGRKHAADAGVSEFILPTWGDLNRWRPKGRYDVIIANQSLHHVLELEDMFASLGKRLVPGGVLLISDMIGRNGHRLWPEAKAAVQPFWDELPESYRFNRLMNRMEPELIDHDCSEEGFEGIRAQDILPLLVENFHFELFIPFANIALVFVDRPFGHNFDAGAEWDRDFIDRVHARDVEGLMSGELKPTQMIAVLRNEPKEIELSHPTLTPEYCIRWPLCENGVGDNLLSFNNVGNRRKIDLQRTVVGHSLN